MNKLFLLAMPFLIACSSEHKTDTMPDDSITERYMVYGNYPELDSGTDSGDAGRDIMACRNTFDDDCMPPCLVMPSKTEARKSCISHCEYVYRVCAGCYGDMPNE